MDMLSIIRQGPTDINWQKTNDAIKEMVTMLQSNDSEFFFIASAFVTPEVSVAINHLLENEPVYLNGIFEIGNCYLNSMNELYSIWHVSKMKSSSIKTSVFVSSVHIYRDEDYESDKPLEYNVPYTKKYLEYIKSIEDWIKTGSQPSDDKEYNYFFNDIPNEEFEKNKAQLYARFYRKGLEKIRKLLVHQKIVELGEVADITIVEGAVENKYEKVKTIRTYPDLSYPFDIENDVTTSYKTNLVLHRGDLIKARKGKYFLLDIEPPFELYAPCMSEIIRPKPEMISPEYLFFYLNGEINKRVLELMSIPLRLDGSKVGSFRSAGPRPVVLPEKEAAFYETEFKKVSLRYYFTEQQEKLNNPQTAEDALQSEIINSIPLYQKGIVMNLIEKDVSELNACYKAKAYKATLIMAGSILEALLIDWLSEIDQKDYFSEDYRVKKWDKNNKRYVVDNEGNPVYIKAELNDYIRIIKCLKHPEWMEESRKAHEIRKNRNCVHAKLCLKEGIQITEELCKKVIQYLNDVIESRKADLEQ